MSSADGQVLDHYLHTQYEVIRLVHDNLASIRAVASHLTPVEDLVDFRASIEAIYAKLGLLVTASELILSATPPGIGLLTAADAAAQRLLLELKSAALRDENYFATADGLAAAMAAITSIQAELSALWTELATKVSKEELSLALAPLLSRLDDLDDEVFATDSRITNLTSRLETGEFNVALATALDSLTTRVGQTETGLFAEAQRTTALEASVVDLTNGVTGNAQALNQLTVRVESSEHGIDAIATDVTQLNTQVANLETGQTGQSTALQQLTSRTTTIEGQISTQATALTQLSGQINDAANQAQLNGSAIDTLSTRMTSSEFGQAVISEAQTALTARIVNTETGLDAQATAVNGLTTRVEQTEDSLVIASEERTALRSSLTSVGNHLPNSSLEADLRGWTLFSRGDGWLAGALVRDLVPSLGVLPTGMHALGITVAGVPAGDAGVRLSNVPVEDLASYLLSGYLAAVNCTVRMEWRVLDSTGAQIGFGVVGSVTDSPPSARLSEWTRVYAPVPVDLDGAQLQVQLWVTAAHVGVPQAWLLRPQLEDQVGEMAMPSPWMDGVTGLSETFAEAVQTLDTRVTQQGQDLEAVAASVTDLGTQIGAVRTWQINNHAGSGDYTTVNAPMAPGLRKAGEVDPVHTFGRGLTLLHFGMDGELASATRYDTYASATERNNLRDALWALGSHQAFVLVSQDHHGIKQADLIAALEDCGALIFKDVVGSQPYILIGRRGLGPGGGVEIVARGSAQWNEHYLTVVNDTPQGLGNQSGLADMVAIQANALETLTTTVTSNSQGLTAASDALTALDARLATSESDIDAQGSAIDGLGTRVTETEGNITILSQSNTALESRMVDAEAASTAASTAVTNLTTRVEEAEGIVSAVSSDQTALLTRLDNVESAVVNEIVTSATKDAAHTSAINLHESRLTDAETELASTSSGLSELTTRVNTVEGTTTSNANHLTQLQSQVNALDLDAGGSGQAISDLDTRVTANESAITSQGQAITSLQNSVTNANKIFVQAGAPPVAGRSTGDLWFDTDNNNKPYVFSDGAWRLRSDLSKNRIFVQGTQPTAENTNDVWVDTARNNRLFRWTGSAWVEITDTRIASTATAVTALTTRVTAAENVNTSQSSAITTLENTVNNATTGVSATAAGLSALKTRVTATEDSIDSHSTDITALKNTVNNTTTGVTATASGLSALKTRVTATETTNTSQGQAITSLQNTVNNSTTGVTATANALSALTTRVTSAEGVNTSQGSAITTLQNTVNNGTTGVTATASAVSALKTRVTNVEGDVTSHASSISTLSTTVGGHTSTISNHTSSINGLHAKQTLTMNVNGHISGTESVNNGKSSSFSVLSTIFRIISSASTGLEWQNGYLRAYSGSIQLILGINFGRDNNLCFWYGSNVGEASAHKGNGTIWFDNVGGAYFGGSLSAGILKNSVTSTQIGSAAVAEIGRFNTNGGTKVITFSLAYSNIGYHSTNLGNAALSGTIVLERSYDGGAWTQISSRALTGNRVMEEYEAGIGYWHRIEIAGSSTFTDNYAGTNDFNYRVRITAANGWPYTLNRPTKTGTQSLSITSIEE